MSLRLALAMMAIAVCRVAAALAPAPHFLSRRGCRTTALAGLRCCDGQVEGVAGGEKAGAKLPAREIDSRGFIVPQVGDVVKMPSKWPGEWDVGQVDFVQYVGSRGAYEVDLLPLKQIGDDMWCMPGKKPSMVRTDVAKLGRLPTEYVPERDAYRVNPLDLEPLGGRKVEDPDVTAQGLAEYAELKSEMLREAALLGGAGALASLPFFGPDVAGAFALGTASGCAYLFLLQRETDAVYSSGDMGRVLTALVNGRLAMPAVVLLVLAAQRAAGGAQLSLSLVPREQFGAVVLGFLTYKAPLLARQIVRGVQELTSNEDAQVPIEVGAMPTGSVGMMAKVLKAGVRSKEEREAMAAATAAQAAGRPPSKLIVLCGPSGVGKSTLIARLLAEAPERFGFSISCTTRPPRAGEVDGDDYYFLSEDKFDSMIERGDFIEWALVGGSRYGTSVSGVEAVAASGKVCLLDLDVQGVQALIDRGGLDPYCVWLAPPSLDALRARLRARGTEQSADIEKRIGRAVEEIQFSLSARCFDKTILNDNLDEAYEELKQVVYAASA